MNPNPDHDPWITTMLRTYALFLLIVISLGFAGGCDKADAAVTPPPAGWGVVYQEAAVSYYGGATPLGCATVAVEFDSSVPPPGDMGLATIPASLGTQCHIYVVPMVGWSIYYRCVVYAHEYGHTLGLQHSSDVSSVMYAPFEPALVEDQACREVVQRAHDGRWDLFSERMVQ